MKKWLFLSTLLFVAASIFASPVETFQFKDEVTKVRFQSLTKELRCPKCQNQDLADSNSPIAADLRRKIYDMLQAGRSDSEITNYMVDRYGDFVLYRPRVNSLTYILWFAPIGFIVLGAVVVFLMLRNRKQEKSPIELTAEQKSKLTNILKK